MDKSWLIFTPEQGTFLIRLLLAHFVADFGLQTRYMVRHKSWLSVSMLVHIVLVCLCVFLFTFSWRIALVIAMSHWLIDGVKKKWGHYLGGEARVFLADQLLHLLVLLLVWTVRFGVFPEVWQAIALPFTVFDLSLVLLAYVLVVWPIGYFIGFLLRSYNPSGHSDKAGRLIGQFERIIILTLVLLQQYEAIGFLITGKSIIRFSGTHEEKKSEYVLLGTMLSYAVAIVLGVVIRFMLEVST